MSGLSELYQEILLEHNSKPRNFRKVDDPSRTVEGFNPLCGDQITLYLKVAGDVIEDLSLFEGSDLGAGARVGVGCFKRVGHY